MWNYVFQELVSERLTNDTTTCLKFLLCQVNRKHLLSWQHRDEEIENTFVNLHSTEKKDGAALKFVVYERGKTNPFFDEKELFQKILQTIEEFVPQNRKFVEKDTTLQSWLKEIDAIRIDRLKGQDELFCYYLIQIKDCIYGKIKDLELSL